MTDELKPCPFCGGKTSFSTAKAVGYTFYVAECIACKALLSKLSKGELLTAWNRRDYSHIEVTDAMVEAAGAASHDDARAMLTAALNVKEG